MSISEHRNGLASTIGFKSTGGNKSNTSATIILGKVGRGSLLNIIFLLGIPFGNFVFGESRLGVMVGGSFLWVMSQWGWVYEVRGWLLYNLHHWDGVAHWHPGMWSNSR